MSKLPIDETVPSYTELVQLLSEVADHTDADCPQAYRTRHLKESLADARAALLAVHNAKIKPKAPPTVLVNLIGGCVHQIRTTPGLDDVLFVFGGDSNDCDPDKLVPLGKSGEMFVYSTGAADEEAPLSVQEADAIHAAAMDYNDV
jgi:hypothetical protein